MKTYFAVLFATALVVGCGGNGDSNGAGGGSSSSSTSTSSAGGGGGGGPTPEDVVTQKIAGLRGDPKAEREFLVNMPKGGDLHVHTSGAVSTESFIAWGSQDGACVDTMTFTATAAPCAPGAVLLSTATPGSALYNQVLGAWSMEGLEMAPLLTRHQHFFDAFGKFGATFTNAHNGDAIAELMSLTAKNHQSYLELMQSFGSGAVGAAAGQYFMPNDTWDSATLLAKRLQIMADPAFATTMTAAKASIAQGTTDAQKKLGCGTASADPGCGVTVRYLLSANRTGAKTAVFGQWVFAFELAQQAPEVVGVNLVSPEEDANSLANYDDEMKAVDILHTFYASDPSKKPVHVSLHAGELIKDVLPMTPQGQKELTYHIRHAVELAHAERIGHAVDVLGESEGNGPDGLFTEMAAKGVLVEACLSSNATLLDAAGMTHPIHAYLDHGVPVTLATDDEGILRLDITDEYTRAAIEQKLDYPVLKSFARASLEHSFLPGENLWKAAGKYTAVADACAKDALGDKSPSAACAAFLMASQRATQQWQLEGDFTAFEAAAAKP